MHFTELFSKKDSQAVSTTQLTKVERKLKMTETTTKLILETLKEGTFSFHQTDTKGLNK